MLIYKIVNKINGKVYIGQTIRSIEDRWSDHCKNSSRCTAIKNAIVKYGIDNFKISTISYCNSLDEMNHREERYISLYNTMSPNGYNLQPGGKNHKLSNETKAKLSHINKDTIPPSRKGSVLTEKHKRQISKKLKGRKRDRKSIEKFKKTIATVGTNNRKVLCITNNIKYPSLSKAASELGISVSSVWRCASGIKIEYKGLRFEYVEQD